MQFINIVPGVSKDDPAQCNVTPEARAYLSQLHNPLAIVCGAGPFRCHKSWLLSHLLDPHTREFSTSPSVRPHTRGLWIATKCIEKTNILLMDTEGLSAPNSTEALDTNILALAIILSCKVVFCTKGRIDSTAFDSLQSATVMARWFNEKASEETKNDILASKPQLLWILRDFGLQLDDANKKPITASNYLENVLNEANPELRNSLQQLFVSRACIPMVYPVNNESELEDMQLRHLKPAFKRDVQIVKDNICASQPKKINSQEMSGPVLLAMADMLCNILSKGGVPKLAPMWKTASDAVNAELRHQIIKSFTQNLHEQFSPEPQLLFWSTKEMQVQMLCALRTWASKQSICQPEDAILMIESCWETIQTASILKLEQWKTNLVKNAQDVSHLLPQAVREAVAPVFVRCNNLEQDLLNAKLQSDEATSALEQVRSTQHSSLASALTNEDELKVIRLDLHRTRAELEEVMNAHTTFREATLEKQKKLKQIVQEHKTETQEWNDKEQQFLQETAQLTKRVEELTHEKQSNNTECITLRQSTKEATTQVASEMRKRKLTEDQMKTVETEMNFLKQNKIQLDSTVSQLTNEQSKLKMENFKLQCLVDIRNA